MNCPACGHYLNIQEDDTIFWCSKCGGTFPVDSLVERQRVGALTERKVREWRADATENIERIDSRRGATPAQQHLDALLRPREVRIQTLCEELLEGFPPPPALPRCERHMTPLAYMAYPDEQMAGEMVCTLCDPPPQPQEA